MYNNRIGILSLTADEDVSFRVRGGLLKSMSFA